MGIRIALEPLHLMNENISQIHTPVLLERCIELLAPALERDDALFVDATMGMGGHSEALLDRFSRVRVVGIDRDPHARAIAASRLSRFGDRVRIVAGTFDEIEHVLSGEPRVDAILFDLGVSSLQLDKADRGFSYSQDAPLDMRMNPEEGVTAAEILSDYSEADLRELFYRFGDEKLAPRYARAIVAERQLRPIESSAHLVSILQDATPAALKNAGHPAKRVFQALRVEVNRELEVLERALPAALKILGLHGRIVIMSYQSLEDRLVKRVLAAACASTAPAGLPQELPEHQPRFKLLVRGAEQASPEEQLRNPRSTSVRLRAAERIREAA